MVLDDSKATEKQILLCFTGIQSKSLFLFSNTTDNSQV